MCYLTGHTGYVTNVCRTLDGKYLISGGRDNTIRVWNMSTNTQEAILSGDIGEIKSLCLSLDGKHLISGCWGGTIRIWS